MTNLAATGLARWARWLAALLLVGVLAGCASAPPGRATGAVGVSGSTAEGVVGGGAQRSGVAASEPGMVMGKSRWVPVAWSDLPGFDQDNWFDGWGAWVRSCERPSSVWQARCAEVRGLSLATDQEQRDWLQQYFQAYRVESLLGDRDGLLTGYFEPELAASRVATSTYSVPLYGPPAGLVARKPWYTRKEMDTLPVAQEALAGHVIAYVADPVDAMVLQIQGSGRLRFEPEGGGPSHMVRLTFAASNEQPYRSVGRWLLDQGLAKDASWPGIKAWLAENPQRRDELLWSNPRTVFFREQPLLAVDADAGPPGAQGVALTPQRSIAVDPGSIPYGTPVWLVSEGTQTSLHRLVIAQDTGSAIVGAVRADYFAGAGAAAADLAGRLRQSLQMWAIWPK